MIDNHVVGVVEHHGEEWEVLDKPGTLRFGSEEAAKQWGIEFALTSMPAEWQKAGLKPILMSDLPQMLHDWRKAKQDAMVRDLMTGASEGAIKRALNGIELRREAMDNADFKDEAAWSKFAEKYGKPV